MTLRTSLPTLDTFKTVGTGIAPSAFAVSTVSLLIDSLTSDILLPFRFANTVVTDDTAIRDFGD